MIAWVAGGWVILLGGLSLSALVAALLVKTRIFSARAFPLDVVIVGTPTVFAWMVHPALGMLATLGAGWWLVYGFPRAAGGILWPLIALVLWLGLQAPPPAMDLALAMVLAAGVVQAAIAVSQQLKFRWIMAADHQPHGIIGHRTGLGIFMALVMPLAFLAPAPYSWGLLAVYATGLILSQSATAAAAALAGMLVTVPWLWPVAVMASGWATLWRVIERSGYWAYGSDGPPVLKRRWHLANIGYSLRLRREIWRATWTRCWSWPHWLVGHGPGAFQQHGRRWTFFQGLKEVYREAHNDYLEFFYEHGAVGLLAVGLWLVLHRAGFAWQDPITGSLVAFGVAMLAHFPAKVMTLAGVALLDLIVIARRIG